MNSRKKMAIGVSLTIAIALLVGIAIVAQLFFFTDADPLSSSTQAVTSAVAASSAAAPRYGSLSSTKFVDVSIGYYFGGALDADGNVWVWGQNGSGQLGNGKTASAYSGQGYAGGMQQVPGLPQIKHFSAGESYGLAVDYSGDLWGWGYNGSKQTGYFGNFLPVRTPFKLERATYGIGKLVKAAAGVESSMALDENGNVWTWGTNGYGQHGDGKRSGFTPTQAKVPNPVVAIEMGRNNALALDNNGDVWAWGLNSYGEAGNAKNKTIQDTPQKVVFPAGTKIKEISLRQNWALALDENGNVWQWGKIYGQKGFGTVTLLHTPEIVGIDETANIVAPTDGKTKASIQHQSTYQLPGVATIKAGCRNSYFVDTNGKIWTWGDNEFYAFGVVTDYYAADYCRVPIWSAKAIQAPTITGNGDQNTKGQQLSWLHPQVSGSSTDPTTHYEYAKQTFPTGFWNEAGIGIDPTYAKVQLPFAEKIETFTSSYVILDADGNLWVWSYDSIGTIVWGHESMNIPLPSHAKWLDSGLWDLFIYEPALMRGMPAKDSNDATVYYEGVMQATNAAVPGFSMASEQHAIGANVTATPPTFNDLTCVGYLINGVQGTGFTPGSPIAFTVATHPTKITFLYAQSPSMATVNFDAVMQGTNAPVPGFSMASEQHAIGANVTATPPTITSLTCVGYLIDGVQGTGFTPGSPIAFTVATHPTNITFIYAQNPSMATVNFDAVMQGTNAAVPGFSMAPEQHALGSTAAIAPQSIPSLDCVGYMVDGVPATGYTPNSPVSFTVTNDPTQVTLVYAPAADMVDVNYEGVMYDTGAPVSGFAMAAETHVLGDIVQQTPQAIAGLECVGYQINGVSDPSYTSGSAIAFQATVNPTLVTFIYAPAGQTRNVDVYIRQVLSDPPAQSRPDTGEAMFIVTGESTGLSYQFLSGELSTDYTYISLPIQNNLYRIEPVLPAGLQLDLTNANPNTQGVCIGTNYDNELPSTTYELDFAASNTYFITIYVTMP